MVKGENVISIEFAQSIFFSFGLALKYNFYDLQSSAKESIHLCQKDVLKSQGKSKAIELVHSLLSAYQGCQSDPYLAL